MEIVGVPGLHARTGMWGYCAGLIRPRVVIDPICETMPGGNALIIHEAEHACAYHALFGLIVLLCTGGMGYLHFRRWAERRADYQALRLMGEGEFRAFIRMHPHPKTRVGRFLYGATPQIRFNRAWSKVCPTT